MGTPWRALHLGGVLLHGLLHAQGGVAGAHRVVLMRQRCPKQGHDAIAHDLVDGAFVLVHGRHHAVEHRIEQLPRLLGVALGQQLHRPLEVGKQHRDLLALAFQSGAGGEDLLGQIWRGVRQGRPVLSRGGCYSWRWDRLWGTSPEQAAARVVDHLGMRVEEFVFERL